MEKEKKEETTGNEEPIEEPADTAEIEDEIAETEETLEKEEEPTKEKAEAEAEKPVEEQVKPSEREEKKEKKEEEIVEERIYTIPLGKAWIMPPNKRAPRAIRMIKSFVIKHMKMEARKEEGEEEEEPGRLIVDADLNERVWRRGIEKPPRKVRVRAAKDKDGDVTVSLAEGD